MTDFMFTRDGQRWLPQDAALGPWGASLHGGAPAALLAYALEEAVGGRFPLARLTLDLFRPVPASPLEIAVRPLREGRRLSVNEAILCADGVEFVRAVAVYGDEVALSAELAPPACPVPLLEQVPETSLADAMRRSGRASRAGVDGLHHRLRLRLASGVPGSGACSAWLRLPLELAPGVPLSPVVHLAGCSDFANGLAQRVLSVEGGSVGFINADISLHLLRAPTSDRIAMTARNEVHAGGRALVSAEIWQADGLVARVTQTALVMPHS